MEVDKGIKLEEIKLDETDSKDIVNSVEKLKKGYERCIRCLELQEEITKANEKCGRLELDVSKKSFMIECLEGKLAFLELKNLRIEHEIRVLKQRNEELERSMGNGEEEDDRITQLMIENNVLECEKKKAESEIGDWKVKCKELEMNVIEFEKRFAGVTKKDSDLPEIHAYNIGCGLAVVRMETENKVNADKDASAGTTPVNNLYKEKENEGLDGSGTAPVNTPSKLYTGAEGYKGSHQFKFRSRVRKCLDFAAERNSPKNISPSTPGGKPPFGPIDISDSDDDLNNAHMELSESKRRRITRRAACIVTSESENDSDDNIPISRLMCKHTLGHSSDDLKNRKSVNDSCSKADNSKKVSPRRRLIRVGTLEDKSVLGKGSCKGHKNLGIIGTINESTDEDEIEDDDSCSKADNSKKVSPRRHLIKVGTLEDKSVLGKGSCKGHKNLGIIRTINEITDEDEIEDDDSHSEGESLGGFIVNSSDVSESDSSSNCNGMSENHEAFSSDHSANSENSSESSMAYDEVISGLRRNRKDKTKWEFEADMLADFGKCPELCMKAVCALYRQQTSEEKSFKATIVLNGRGFNHVHAFSGSALAEFLTDGDPHGDVKKSVKELQEYDAKGVEKCRKLATHYSKQLFEIYKNKEDPFFHP